MNFIKAFISLFVVFGVASCATTPTRFPTNVSVYYVDAQNGDDQSDGLDPARAWKTIEKVNRVPLKPGDTILLKRGQIWHEKIVMNNSGTSRLPISLGSFGEGPPPILSGAVDVSRREWKQIATHVWATSLSDDEDRKPERIFINDKPLDDRLLKETLSELKEESQWAWENVGGGTLYFYSKKSPRD